MNREDILLEIKKTEEIAERRISDAEAASKSAIAQARRESVTKVQEAQKKINQDFESALAKQKSELDGETSAKLLEGETNAKALTTTADNKSKEINDFLLKAFERSINVSS